jgi:hypothetical protein
MVVALIEFCLLVGYGVVFLLNLSSSGYCLFNKADLFWGSLINVLFALFSIPLSIIGLSLEEWEI